ncbi:MAG: hypothetical protein K1X66_02310 [Verrucomicrobiae bacterium]|nr:hypothetical protein [Verrucomicrobiae bacterium]
MMKTKLKLFLIGLFFSFVFAGLSESIPKSEPKRIYEGVSFSTNISGLAPREIYSASRIYVHVISNDQVIAFVTKGGSIDSGDTYYRLTGTLQKGTLTLSGKEEYSFIDPQTNTVVVTTLLTGSGKISKKENMVNCSISSPSEKLDFTFYLSRIK